MRLLEKQAVGSEEECALKEMPLVVRKRLSNHSKVKDLCLVKTNFLLLIGREIPFFREVQT